MKRRHNPRGSGVGTAVAIVGLAGLGFVGYKAYQSNAANVQNNLKNLLAGTPPTLPSGVANPSASPWLSDTGYTIGSGPGQA